MFAVTKVKYRKTRRGIDASGTITKGGKEVGTFYQKAFAACIPTFQDKKIEIEFARAAMKKKQHACDYLESLLQEWEENFIKQS